jgi:hypothetical protein
MEEGLQPEAKPLVCVCGWVRWSGDWPSGPTALSAALLVAINHISSARNVLETERRKMVKKRRNRVRSESEAAGGGGGT